MSWLSKGLRSIGKSPLLSAAVSVIPGVGPVIAMAGKAAATMQSMKREQQAMQQRPAVYDSPMQYLPPQQTQALPRMTNVMATMPALGRMALRSPAVRRAGRFAAGAGSAMGLSQLLPEQWLRGARRYRRISPTNPKALKRAIRRVKAFRKISQKIESLLPKRAASKPQYAFQKRRK